MQINEIQSLILSVISEWVKIQRTPITQKKIVELITVENEFKISTVKAAVRVLVSKGYIRKSCQYSSGASYVQLRTA